MKFLKAGKIVAAFLAIIVVVFVLWIGIGGLYPVAVVNNKIITADEFNKSYFAYYNFYRTGAMVAKQSEDVLKSDNAVKELKHAAIQALIEIKIIEEELEKRYSKADLAELINKKIKEAENHIKNEDFKKSASSFYGLDIGDFEKIVLVPQAERELLEGNLSWDKKNIDDWIKEKKSNLEVKIFVPGFDWDAEKGEVVVF